MTTQKDEIVHGVLSFVSTEKAGEFTNDLTQFLETNNYNVVKNHDNPLYLIMSINRQLKANWTTTKIFSCSDNPIQKKKSREKQLVQIPPEPNVFNNTKYRIVIMQLDNSLWYFERNGQINISEFLENYSFSNLHLHKPMPSNPTEFKTKVMTAVYEPYELDTTKVLPEFANDIRQAFYPLATADVYIDMFDNLTQVDVDDKLIPYVKSECMLNNKSSETKYNANIGNNSRYVVVDCRLIRSIEVADVYDCKTQYWFHNKKTEDLRVLAAQIMNSLLVLQTSQWRQEYLKIVNADFCTQPIPTDFTNIVFVAGLIQTKRNISPKDKMVLAQASEFLKNRGATLKVDYIEYIERG